MKSPDHQEWAPAQFPERWLATLKLLLPAIIDIFPRIPVEPILLKLQTETSEHDVTPLHQTGKSHCVPSHLGFQIYKWTVPRKFSKLLAAYTFSSWILLDTKEIYTDSWM